MNGTSPVMITCISLLCVSTDARPQAPTYSIQYEVHGELPGATRALAASSATAVLASGAGSAAIVFACGSVSTARLTKSSPPTPAPPTSFAPRSRRGRG